MKLSIRKFLLFNLLLALVLSTTLSAVGNYYLDLQDIHYNLDTQLTQAAFTFKSLIEESVKAGNLAEVQAKLDRIPNTVLDFFSSPHGNDYVSYYKKKYQFQVWDLNHHLLLHSADAPKEPMYGRETGFSDKYIGKDLWRVFTIHDVEDNLIYVISEDYTARNKLAQRLTEDDIIIMLIIYPITGLLIWFIIGRGLYSITRVAREVSQRAADHLNPVDMQEVPVEIQPLVDELNKLFLRLKQAFDREQRFAADAAHELRTPLAALRTQAQVALKATEPSVRQLHLQNVIAGVDRCTHVIQQLLILCRMTPEAVILEDQVEVDLTKLAREVIGQLAPMAINKKIDIELIAKDSNCVVMGNVTGLHAMLRNLVDNSIRYTPENGSIKVYVIDELKEIVIKVIDSGPGIPPDLRSRVFERFFRVLGTSAPGSGLGLAIVQQIVNLHHGDVVLGVPENGVGLEIKVTLPKKVLLTST